MNLAFYSNVEELWSLLSLPSFPWLLGLGRGVPLPALGSHSSFLPFSFLEREQQGGNCLSSPRTAGGRKLWQAPSSPRSGIPGGAVPAPRLGSPTFGCTSSTCHLLCTAQGLALAPCQSPNRALCFRWRPEEWQEDVPERESRENAGLHSLSNGSWRHLQRQLPNRQGLCQAAVCPGMRSSAHMAEQGCTICHTPMPVSSL